MELQLSLDPLPRNMSPAVDVPNKAGKTRKKRPRAGFSDYKMSFDSLYELKHYLGEGAGSKVYACVENRTGEEFAVKMITPDTPAHRKRILKEVEILHICQEHPHIIDMKEFIEERGTFYLIYQKMDGGPLLDHIAERGFFSEVEVRNVMREIGDALRFLHSRGIAHRDLKPANILCERVDEVTPVRICDFDLGSAASLANRVTTPELLTPVGSCEYMAPEVVAAFADDDLTYDKKCDMWSLGVILYILLCGKPPFQGHCGQSDCEWDTGGDCYTCKGELLENIRYGRYSVTGKEWEHVSDEAKDLVRALLVKDVKNRYTVDQLLRHPFITGEACSAEPLATPSVLKRRGSNSSIEFFSTNVMSLLRQHGYDARDEQRDGRTSQRGPIFPVTVSNRSCDRSSESPCFDSASELSCSPGSLQLLMPNESALAQRRKGHIPSSTTSTASE